ncbi:hypothetical protein Pssp01_63470 [Pseudomonas sp. NBRC 100443]|nr:hypothetical protein Pssp01_63470 [Pseudomonas sp. NBRC 100443]
MAMRRAMGTRRWRRAWYSNRKKLSGLTDVGRVTAGSVFYEGQSRQYNGAPEAGKAPVRP